MWHELVVRAVEEAPPSTTTPVGAIVALIGAVALLIGALTGLFATLRGRNSHAPVAAPSPLHTDDTAELAECEQRCRAYELFLWRARFNPNRIITGEEPAGEVQFE